MVDLDAGLFAKLDMIYDWKSPQFGLDDMRNIVNNFTSCWKLMVFWAISIRTSTTIFSVSVACGRDADPEKNQRASLRSLLS